MKQYFIALSTAALVSVAPYALASSTDLTVTGVITPAACTPTLSNGGVVDNGKISAKDLDQVRETLVGTHPLQLSVSCDGPTQFALKPVDHQAGTAALTSWFGPLDQRGRETGLGSSQRQNAVADGVAAQAIDSDDAGKTWKATCNKPRIPPVSRFHH
jgi:type 1 fimbria pilin